MESSQALPDQPVAGPASAVDELPNTSGDFKVSPDVELKLRLSGILSVFTKVRKGLSRMFGTRMTLRTKFWELIELCEIKQKECAELLGSRASVEAMHQKIKMCVLDLLQNEVCRPETCAELVEEMRVVLDDTLYWDSDDLKLRQEWYRKYRGILRTDRDIVFLQGVLRDQREREGYAGGRRFYAERSRPY